MSHAVYLSAGLDRTSVKPLFRQLYESISRKIQDGSIVAGGQLPASRVFAGEIGVSRATVLAAYDQLMAEGYVEGRRGAGVFVADLQADAGEWVPNAKRSQRRIEPADDHRSAPPFYPGSPDMRLFPKALWAQYVGRVARADPGAMLDMPDPFGDPVLRATIADHLQGWRGVRVDPGQVVVTAGAGDALELVLQTVAEPGARIGLEDPGYGVMRQTCKVMGYRLHWLKLDRDGARLPKQNVPLAASVITPSYQFPLGGTMPVIRV